MKQRGTITIFLCLVLVSISAIICGLVESARIAGVRFYLQIAADSAMDSVFSEYDNKLWEEYRLIARTFSDEEELKMGLGKYAKPYVEESGIYRIHEPEFVIMDRQMLTDEGGAWFEEEASEYMKYKVVSDLVLNADPTTVWKQIKEAESMNEITSDYGLSSKTAVKLEKSLMRIGEHLEAQKGNLQRAADALNATGLNEFVSKANTLKNKSKEIPALVQKYQKLADKLSKEIVDAEEKNKEKWEELSEANQRILEEQIAEFKPYVERDGERRAQVERLLINGEDIRQICEEAIDLANYIMDRKEEEENSAEDTDGDGIIDYYVEYEEYEEDLERLRTLFAQVSIMDIGYEYGVKDEEASDILESMQEALEKGVMELVIPSDRDVQNGKLNLSDLPSRKDRTARSVEHADLLKSLLVNEYALEHFPSFTDNAKRDFAYEMEYIISGDESGRTNLNNVVLQLIGIRSGLNYMHIITNTDKMTKASLLANTIALSTGTPFLNSLIKFLIITVWAMVEAILDVKDLLAGQEVKLIKSPEDWHLDVDKILDIGRNKDLIRTGDFKMGKSEGTEESKEDAFFRMDYKFYLRLLLFLKKQEDKNYRMMDLIQNNLSKSASDFRMKNCIYGVRTKVDVEFETVFSNLGLVRSELSGVAGSYRISTESVKVY